VARSNIFHNGEKVCVEVVLSRRNLLALLHKLDMEGSARTLHNNDSYIEGNQSSHLLILKCEDDDEHYAKRESGVIGVMHADTETHIAENGGVAGNTLIL